MISDDRRVLQFGTGDIRIGFGSDKDAGYLIFSNLDTPLPIGTPTVNPNGKIRMYRIHPADVLMKFTCPESIDAVIQCLTNIRKMAFDTGTRRAE